MMKDTQRSVRAQSLSEYIILISIVVVVMAAMFPLVKRGTQSLIKTGADQIGDQRNSEQDFGEESAHLNSSTMVVDTNARDSINQTNGKLVISANSSVRTRINSVTNMGLR